MTVNATCELVHSLDSESAARRLEIPALVQVNLAGEESKSGVSLRTQLEQFLAACQAEVVGLSTMPPLADDPEDPDRTSAACASSRSAMDWLSSRWARHRTTVSPRRRERRW